VLDRYNQTLVLKLYTTAWLRWLEDVLKAVVDRLRPERVVLRLSRNVQANAATNANRREEGIIFGPKLDAPVVFKESGLLFEADVLRGQKTGFFLDQRENRGRVEHLAEGLAVLNVFSFSGGFSLYAARGGARSVTEVDISAHALSSAQRNYSLNKHEPRIGKCTREQIQSDAFKWLAASSTGRFGLIILDPPSLAKRETERPAAIAAYKNLATLGLRRLDRGGVLVACSCSAHVTDQEFFRAVQEAAHGSGRGVQELGRYSQPADHPASIPEARYIKSVYLKVT